VLGTDAAVSLLYPLVYEGFKLLLYRLVELPDWDVEVQVRVTHVAVSDNINYRV
jgi:hypothetical protein